MRNFIGKNAKTALGIACTGVVVYAAMTTLLGRTAVPAVSAQTDQFLARRVDQMENRFYSIESRLNRVEQNSRPSAPTPRMLSEETEIQFLRTQVDSLRTRLGEAECALLRIDERTLTPAARAVRNRAGATADPCRREPAAPVLLSARP